MTRLREIIEPPIKRYLALFDGQETPTSQSAIVQALDDLVQAYFALPEVEPASDGQTTPSSFDERAFARKAAQSFENDDIIWFIDPQGGPDQGPMCAFASEELAEIANDLARVLSEIDNAGDVDAAWEVRFGYQTHWGEHLHRVRSYLHGLGAW